MDSNCNSDPKCKTMKTNKQITVKKITNCSSDHLPIIATIPTNLQENLNNSANSKPVQDFFWGFLFGLQFLFPLLGMDGLSLILSYPTLLL